MLPIRSLLVATVGTLTIAITPMASATTVLKTVKVGTYPTSLSGAFFYISNGADPFTSPVIAANFGDGFSSAVSFDDKFEFTIPTQSGTGSGSISTSFSSASGKLTISDLIIDGTSYVVPATLSGQSFSVGALPIHAGVLNTIEVEGTTASGGGTFSGTATFSAVPEVSTWMMMLFGFGFIGAGLRRKSSLVLA